MEEHHHHAPKISSLNRAFIIGIAVNALYVVIEFGEGLYYNSPALISDASHNLTDKALKKSVL